MISRKTFICHGILFIFSWLWVGGIHANPASDHGYAYLAPLPGSSNHNPETSILIRVAEKLDTSRCELDLFYAFGERSGLHRGSIQVLGDQKTLVFQPDEPFVLSENISVYGPRPLITLSGDTLPSLEYQFSIRQFPLYGDFNDPAVITENNSDIALKSMEIPSMVVSNGSNPTPVHIFTALKTGGEGHLIAFDMEGVTVFHRRFTHYVENVQPWPDGCISFFDYVARAFIILDQKQVIVDTIGMKNGYKSDFHDFLRLPSGHTILMCYDLQTFDMSRIVEEGYVDATLTGLVIQELDENAELIFQWRSWDYFLITDTYADLSSQYIDYLHPNSMYADSNNTLIISCRNNSEITKIDRTDGHIIWRMGGKNNQFTRIGDPKGFTGQHTVSRTRDGNLLLFDNSIDLENDPWLVKQTGPVKSDNSQQNDVYSRGVEYVLSESEKTISFLMKFRHTPGYQANNMGTIQRINNGNTLISWGSSSTLPGMDITEYDSVGNVVFEAGIENITAKFYKVYKYPFHTELFAPLSDSLMFDTVFVGESATSDLIIRNTGDRVIQITSILNNAPEFSVDALFPILIEPGMDHTFRVSFHPLEEKIHSEVLTIYSNTDTSKTARQVILTGAGKLNVLTENLMDRNIKLFPNPSNEQLVVGNLEAGDHIRILNLQGQLVYENKPGDYQLSIDVSGLAPGAYSVQVINSRGHIYIARFICQ